MCKEMRCRLLGYLECISLVVACSPPIRVREEARELLPLVTAAVLAQNENIGLNAALAPPAGLQVTNNETSTTRNLHLQWNASVGALRYKIYLAVCPTRKTREDRCFERCDPKRHFTCIKVINNPQTDWNFPTPITPDNVLMKRPLQSYAFLVTAENNAGESGFSNMVYGWRKPLNALEALKDIDFNMQYSYCHAKDFGQAGAEAFVTDRTGRRNAYHFLAQAIPPDAKSDFFNCTNFEITLDGTPHMEVAIVHMCNKMDGVITATGIYNAQITYSHWIGLPGALTCARDIAEGYLTGRGWGDWGLPLGTTPTITIAYQPGGGRPNENRTLNPEQAVIYMRSVALTNAEKLNKELTTPLKYYYDPFEEDFMQELKNDLGL